LTCRNYYVNKYLRDYSKNGDGISEKAKNGYLLSPKKCKKCDKVVSYEKRESDYCSRECSLALANVNRKGVFWKTIKDKKIINNTLDYYIDLMKEEEPLIFKLNPFSFFTSNNWYIWLIQLNYKLNKKNLQNYNLKDSPEKLLISNYNSFEKNRYLRNLNHYKFINEIYKNKNKEAFF
jgi:hypothetical protein